jgi:peptidoglycan/xylan/chitin deacetylase (PgdA/CDA1 family)
MNLLRPVQRVRREIAFHFSREVMSEIHNDPVISFTFDDFPRSALLCAAPLMDRYGARATYYASLGRAGQESSVGRLFKYEDLRTLIAEEHEIGCHTLSHLSAYRHSAGSFAENCAENRQRMAEVCLDYDLRNFSYPFGDVTLSVKRRVCAAYESCRTSQSGVNCASVDRGCLRGNPIYDTIPLDRMRALIDANTREGGWLILYTHDVAPSPSPFGCTPEYLRELLEYAAGSGAKLLPVRGAIARYSASSAPSHTTRAELTMENDHA